MHAETPRDRGCGKDWALFHLLTGRWVGAEQQLSGGEAVDTHGLRLRGSQSQRVRKEWSAQVRSQNWPLEGGRSTPKFLYRPYFFFCFFLVLGIELTTLPLPEDCFATELNLEPWPLYHVCGGQAVVPSSRKFCLRPAWQFTDISVKFLSQKVSSLNAVIELSSETDMPVLDPSSGPVLVTPLCIPDFIL